MVQPKNPEPNQLTDGDPEFRKHLESLGHSSVQQYQRWCESNGFSRRTNKHWRERCKERSFATRAAADARLAQKKSEVRKPDQAIQSIFRGELVEKHVTQPHLKEICRAYQETVHCRRTKQALLTLVLHVNRCADLFRMEPVIEEYGYRAGNTLIGGWWRWRGIQPVGCGQLKTGSLERTTLVDNSLR